MAILIKNATVLTFEGQDGFEPILASVLIEGDRISAIGEDVVAPDGADIVDGHGKLVMPGLVNAHLHSGETFFKGRYEHMPLEVWMLYAYPILPGRKIPADLLELRTKLVALESLKGGVTTLTDDWFDPPTLELDRLAVVFDAYRQSGIRATVSDVTMDRNVLDTLPFARELVPPELQAKVEDPTVSTDACMEFCRAAFDSLEGTDGRIRFMVSASAPQRCSDEFMQACCDLAERHGSPLHTHVLETKTQAVTGPEFYGTTLIRHMHDIGVLKPWTTIAHSIWVTEDDMALMGEADVSIVHNCVSNQKLGAGVAPVRRLLDAGVNVGLGTDGLCSNDTARIFDVIRAAALIHGIATPDYSQLVSAREILYAATLGGARTALLENEIGSLAPGKKADLLVISMESVDWAPLNDVARHLVYCENGSGIEKVYVDGKLVVEDGTTLLFDERELLAEVRERVPAWLAEHAEIEAANRIFEPYVAQIHRRATAQDIGLDRWQGDHPLWPGVNRPVR